MRDELFILKNGAIFCGRPKMTKVIYFLWTGGVFYFMSRRLHWIFKLCLFSSCN